MDIIAIEEKYSAYKEAFDNGELDTEAFQSAVDALRIQDDYGRFWTIGAESGNWYYYNGAEWSQANPDEVDDLPFVDENGVYWMLGQESNAWHYFDGEAWVRTAAGEAAGTVPYDTATYEDDTQYYVDDEGRYWTIGKKSGEWYFYDTGGWHKASDLIPSPAYDQPAPQQPYQPAGIRPSPPPSQPYTAPFQPVQPAPAYYQPQQPAQTVDPYSHTQPIAPQPASQPGPQQPVYPYDATHSARPQPQATSSYSEPVAPYPQQQPAPAESAEPGVWMYFDGEKWLRYQEDPNAPEETLTTEAYADRQDEYFEDEAGILEEDEEVIEIEDLDDFVEVVEVEADDIIDLNDEEDLLDAEFEVSVLRPGETPKPTESPSTPGEPVTATEAIGEAATQDVPTTSLKSAQITADQAQPAVAPKAAVQPQKVRPEFSPKAVPTWFWTSLSSVVLLVAIAALLIGILHAFKNREEAEAVAIALETPTLPAGAPASTPTEAPTPSPTPTLLPTNTPVPLAHYNSDYFGFSVDYPAGWVFDENDDLVIFAPSTRSLNNNSLNGAVMWVTLSESTDITELLAKGLERFAPISETLNEGAMDIGTESWISAQVRFNSEELSQDAIALVAATTNNGSGYTLVAVAPAAEWEDFVPLFQHPINSLAFAGGQPVAQATRSENSTSNATTASTGPDSSGSTDEPTPTSQPTLTATEAAVGTASQEPVVHTIEPGDTLFGLAFQYDVSVNDILTANNLPGENVILSIGQELIIPQGGVVVAAVTATPTQEADTPTPATEAGQDSASTPEVETEPTATLTTAPASPTPAPTPAPTNTPEPAEIVLSGRIVYPAYSTDIKSFNVWSTNVDGSNPVILAGNASQPNWNRNGTLLAYRLWEPSRRGIAYIDYAGGRQDLLTSFIEDGLPVWRRDGTLVFSSRREGDRLPRLFQVDQAKRETPLGFIAEYVDILADGHLVARGCTISGECGLFILLPDGSGELKISNDTSDTAPAGNPIGGRIAIMSFDRGGVSNWEIWTINQDGSDPQRLTENRANDGLPTWSPDGRSIAFVSDRGGVWAIWAMNADGSNQRKLFDMPGPPDGVVLHDEPNSRGWLEERIKWAP